MLDRGAATERLDQLEERSLLLRAREQLVALEQRRQLVDDRRDAARTASRFGRLVRCERGRKRGANRDAERNDVVVGNPPAEVEHRGAEHRLGVWQRLYTF